MPATRNKHKIMLEPLSAGILCPRARSCTRRWATSGRRNAAQARCLGGGRGRRHRACKEEGTAARSQGVVGGSTHRKERATAPHAQQEGDDDITRWEEGVVASRAQRGGDGSPRVGKGATTPRGRQSQQQGGGGGGGTSIALREEEGTTMLAGRRRRRRRRRGRQQGGEVGERTGPAS